MVTGLIHVVPGTILWPFYSQAYYEVELRSAKDIWVRGLGSSSLPLCYAAFYLKVWYCGSSWGLIMKQLYAYMYIPNKPERLSVTFAWEFRNADGSADIVGPSDTL